MRFFFGSGLRTLGQEKIADKTNMIRNWVFPLAIVLLLFSRSLFSFLSEASPGKIRDALQILMHVPSGIALVTRAQTLWSIQDPLELAQKFQWARVSKTDAVITRYFNTKTGEERRERSVTILLKRDQKLEDLVLDIAHELVHATTRAAWDPYDPELTASRYIRAAIEGEGGEVDAVLQECKIALELSKFTSSSMDRCLSYVQGESGELDREQILKDFYRVGSWSEGFMSQLGDEILNLPRLSTERPRLYSSTGRTPYPVALLAEYENLTKIACENSKKRISHLNQSTQVFLKRRCTL